jgi:hypothetical protein
MTAEVSCAVAGAVICALSLAMLVPSWVEDVRTWVAGDDA